MLIGLQDSFVGTFKRLSVRFVHRHRFSVNVYNTIYGTIRWITFIFYRIVDLGFQDLNNTTYKPGCNLGF